VAVDATVKAAAIVLAVGAAARGARVLVAGTVTPVRRCLASILIMWTSRSARLLHLDRAIELKSARAPAHIRGQMGRLRS
jgi:hypothetical protein